MMHQRTCGFAVLLTLLVLVLGGQNFLQAQGMKPKIQTIKLECLSAVGVYSRTNHSVDLHLKMQLRAVSAPRLTVYKAWHVVEALPVEPYVDYIPVAVTCGFEPLDKRNAVTIDAQGTELEWVKRGWASMGLEDRQKPVTARIRYQAGTTESDTIEAKVKIVSAIK